MARGNPVDCALTSVLPGGLLRLYPDRSYPSWINLIRFRWDEARPGVEEMPHRLLVPGYGVEMRPAVPTLRGHAGQTRSCVSQKKSPLASGDFSGSSVCLGVATARSDHPSILRSVTRPLASKQCPAA
jgi:hypothetical protein